MINQLRIYTVNRGMMDEWVSHFNQVLVPVLEKVGMKIQSQWVSEDKSQFIWIRSFDDLDDLKALEAKFYSSADWDAVKDKARSYLARIDVKLMEPVQMAAHTPR